MDRLDELATFVAVIDSGGFAPAARRLRKSPATVTRMIASLEARLGVRLLDRTTRWCVPTEQGRRLADDARTVIGEYEQALSTAMGDAATPRGRLRITAPYFFGREHVASAVLRFLDQHDEISAELDLSDRPTDLHAEGFDLAVRIGTISDETLMSVRVGWVRRVIVASPAYLARRGAPADPDELPGHAVLQHGSEADRPWRLRSGAGPELSIPVRARFAVNQADAALEAARQGRGLVTALSYQVHADLVAGTLVRVLKPFEPEPRPVQIAWPEGRDRLRRVRLMIDHLKSELRRLEVLAAE